jgi:Fur family ferric uptake transcriptional regulator
MARLSRDEGAALLERFHRFLRDHHQPVTRQRDLVAEVVFASPDHLSVEGIERRLKERGERIGTATVYRSLDVLLASGLIKVHDFGEGFKRYEAVAGQVGHGHLICVRCGAVLEFSNEQLERMLPIIADEHDFRHQRHRVEVFGLCHDCQGRLTVSGER